MIELVNNCNVQLIKTNATDLDVARAAWVSFDGEDTLTKEAEPGRVEGLIKFLYKNKHMSCFEHASFTFFLDVPLFVAREFHRHRTMSYNEVSGRYTEMKPRFYCGRETRVQKGKPGDYYFVPGSDEQTAIYLRTKEIAVAQAWDIYQQRLDAGIAKEQAREDLPLSLMTQFYATVNPRNLMQFLTLRNESHALKEIQDVAVQMEDIFKEVMPMTYEAYALDRGTTDKPVHELFRTSPVDDARASGGMVTDSKNDTNIFVNCSVNPNANANETAKTVLEAINKAYNKKNGKMIR